MKRFGCALEVKPFDKDAEDRAKLELAKAMRELVKALLNDDDFWIVKDTTQNDPVGGTRWIGWRIDIPHMKDE